MHPIDELKRLVAARAKATGGPWIWDEPTNWLGLHIRLCNAEYQPIAQVQVSGWKPRSTGKHNANFLSMAGSLDLLAILAAWERDRAVVAALPKTKDGTPIVPGMEVFCWQGHPMRTANIQKVFRCHHDDCYVDISGDKGWGEMSCHQTYSTKELALAARAAESEAR